jgi:membrane-bound ClpP family serine protease
MIEWLTVVFLLLLGIIFLLGEMFFLPGITIAGLFGIAFSGAGIYLGYSYFGDEVGNLLLLISMLVNAITFFYSFKSGLWKKFALNKVINSRVNEEDPVYMLNEGDVGIASTSLRPMGMIEVYGHKFEVVSNAGMIDVGKPVKILRIDGRKILVEEIKSLPM